MHDGTIAQSDAWLQATIDGYVTWARTHNSLLVLTFDEDDSSSANRIPTVLAGANLVPGTYPEQVTHYSVLRTITDANGVAPVGLAADAAPILSVWGDPGNRQPTASFTSSVAGLSAAFDGSASSDPDGPIASYAWTFGDGSGGSGIAPTHTYAVPGTYPVTLTVTDTGGAVGSRTTGVAVGNGIASDAFGRTVSNGWGSADVGGPWAVSGSTGNYAVGAGAASMRIGAGSGPSAILRDVASSDTDLSMTLTTDKPATGSGLYLYVVGRRVAGVGDYRAKVRLQSSGATSVLVERVTSASAETFLSADVVVPGLTYAPGTQLRVRTQMTGTSPTVLRAKVWKAGTTEPAAWQVSATDTAAGYQAAGQLGLVTYLSSGATNAPVTLVVDDVVASSTTPPPVVNSPPTAVFTWTTDALTTVLDATGSTDAEGPIASYAWSFGDSSSGSGAAASHTYAAAGTYQVTLTVTDGAGLARSATHPVVVAPPPANTAPTAEFTAVPSGLAVALDGSASSDAEGAIASYAWDFGDGTTGVGAAPTHAYPASGRYTVLLTVTDAGGLTATATHQVDVSSGPAPDAPPTASFSSSSSELVVTVDASASSDAEGPIASYTWDFGDGGAGTGVSAQHTYAAAGTFTVLLTVTDSAGQAGTVSHAVTVAVAPPPNTPPTASFTASTSDLQVSVDGRASSDAEGAVASYAWSFGDGTTAAGPTATRTYAAPGTYTVTLTVTDAGGLTGSTTRQVTATLPPNTPPTASFAASTSDLQVSVDGRASSDAEGAVSSYAWSFGDGTTAAGPTATRTYAAPGTYTVTLTVTDAGGLTGSTTRSVTVSAPRPRPQSVRPTTSVAPSRTAGARPMSAVLGPSEELRPTSPWSRAWARCGSHLAPGRPRSCATCRAPTPTWRSPSRPTSPRPGPGSTSTWPVAGSTASATIAPRCGCRPTARRRCWSSA